MTMTKRHTLTVRIRRPCKMIPWGISIAGGSDLGTPLVVTRVSFFCFSSFYAYFGVLLVFLRIEWNILEIKIIKHVMKKKKIHL